MRDRTIETLVGVFMLLGIIALIILALKVSGLNSFGTQSGYLITASFDNVGDLRVRAPVTIAGVRIGEVKAIRLDQTTFRATVTLLIDSDQNKLPADTSASIFTQGLLGANYISLNPGFESSYLQNGGVIQNTHPALILENLIGQFLFNAKGSPANKS